MEKNKKLINNLIGIVLIAVSFYYAILIAIRAAGNDVWYDELFSLKLGKMSFAQIAEFTAYDVHPPMYYWYVKVLTSLFQSVDYVAMCKVASFIPYAAMFIIALTMIRKRWGLLTAGLFLLLITIMPNMPVYYVEIRMYSFIMPFLLVQAIMLADILSSKESHKFKWILFFLCSVIVAYTQYFGLIATGGLYLVLLIGCICDRENRRKKLLGFASMVIGALLTYLPWIPFMIRQVTGVVGSYWIQPMGIKSIPGCLKYIFLPEKTKLGYVLAAMLIAVVFIAYVRDALKKKLYADYTVKVSGIIALMCMILVGYFFSILGRPIFVYRYMILVLPVIYLGMACVLKEETKWITALAIILIFLIGNRTMGSFCYEEDLKRTQFEHSEQVLASIPDGSMIVTNFEQVSAVSAYYLDNCDAYIYNEYVVDPVLTKLFKENTYELHGEDIAPYITDRYSNVYYFGTGHERENYVADWEEKGIKVTLLDECLIERYWINVYKLETE